MQLGDDFFDEVKQQALERGTLSSSPRAHRKFKEELKPQVGMGGVYVCLVAVVGAGNSGSCRA